jgi:hypothetical protein
MRKGAAMATNDFKVVNGLLIRAKDGKPATPDGFSNFIRVIEVIEIEFDP